jgi:hypothetical protein
MIRRADLEQVTRSALVMNLGDIGARAQSILADAQAQADRLIAEGRAERERLIATARDEGFRKGYDDGLAKGLDEGRATGSEQARVQATNDLGTLLQGWSAALESFEADRDAMLSAARTEMVELAAEIASRVTRRVIELDASVVNAQMEAVLLAVARPSKLLVRVNPADLQRAGGGPARPARTVRALPPRRPHRRRDPRARLLRRNHRGRRTHRRRHRHSTRPDPGRAPARRHIGQLDPPAPDRRGMRLFAPEFDSVRRAETLGLTGRVRTVRGLTVLASDLPVPIGSLVSIGLNAGRSVGGEVVGFDDQNAVVMVLGGTGGIVPGSPVRLERVHQSVGVGDCLLGRVVDGLGRPIDAAGPLTASVFRPLDPDPTGAMSRRRIVQPLRTGVRAIDLMTPVGRGHANLGSSPGPGVGKSDACSGSSRAAGRRRRLGHRPDRRASAARSGSSSSATPSARRSRARSSSSRPSDESRDACASRAARASRLRRRRGLPGRGPRRPADDGLA